MSDHDFAVTRFLTKLFRSTNINAIDECILFLETTDRITLPANAVGKILSLIDTDQASAAAAAAVAALVVMTAVPNDDRDWSTASSNHRRAGTCQYGGRAATGYVPAPTGVRRRSGDIKVGDYRRDAWPCGM